MDLSNKVLNGGATLYMSVSFVNDKPVLTLQIVNGTTSHEYTYTFENRVANEITGADAKMTFWIRTDAVTSLTVYNETAWENR